MTHENLVGLMVFALSRGLVNESIIKVIDCAKREYDSWTYSESFSFEDYLGFEILDAYASGEYYPKYAEDIKLYGMKCMAEMM